MNTYRNKQELLALLKQQQLLPQKQLGQNFLVDLSIIKTIVEESALNPQDYVVEIGPGLGILTHELTKHAQQVDTIEIDRFLIDYLQKTFSEIQNLKIIHADALKTALPQKPYKLIANIPYYITSPLLRHFLSPQQPQEFRPALIMLLVQKEVAEKICAPAGAQSILSLQVQIFGKPKLIQKVPAHYFHPIPQVDSALLKIDVYPQPLITNIPFFFKIIKMAFSQKRKTLLNSLASGLQLPKEKILPILEKTEIEANKRPQSLSIEEWEKLINNLNLLEA